MKLQLISFALCPFVQRAVISLKEKGESPDVRYIDLMNKPDWFLKLSPRGKVPVLMVDEVALFESQAIVEFLEDVLPEPALRPADPVERARDRAWFVVASEDLVMNQYRLDYGKEESGVRAAKKALDTTLDIIERELEGREYLSGDGRSFGMADVGMAPFLTRAALSKQRGWLDMFEGRPNIDAWAQRILGRDSVQTSVPEDFESLSLTAATNSGAWLPSHHKQLSAIS